MFKIKRERIEYENKTIRMPVKMIANIQKLANKNDVSFNNVAIQCMEYALEHMEEDKGLSDRT
jgi:hypothetical protein